MTMWVCKGKRVKKCIGALNVFQASIQKLLGKYENQKNVRGWKIESGVKMNHQTWQINYSFNKYKVNQCELYVLYVICEGYKNKT